MSLVYWILVAATLCNSEAQVMFPDEINSNSNNNNNNNVDTIFHQSLVRIANSQTDGATPSPPIGPDQSFLNSIINGPGGAQAPSPLINPNCQDKHQECTRWERNGQCKANIDFMAPHCKRSCGYCNNPDPSCVNNSDYCMAWSIRGQCQSNPDYMRYNCKAACFTCGKTTLPQGLRRDSGAKPPGSVINGVVINPSPPGQQNN